MTRVTRINWDQYACALALAAASRSEDPYHQVGAAVMRPDQTVAGLGYNGAPSGVQIDWSDRDARRAKVIHAEMNAMRYVRPGEAAVLACTMMPCRACVLLAAAYGVKRIVYLNELDPKVYDREESLSMAATCGINVTRVTLS